MIHLADPTVALNRDLLDSTGGFAWWYVDLITPEGDGLVLIWSFGLPFLPGYAGAAREGTAPAAKLRPSLNLAIYKRGKPTLYVLQEYAAEDARWHPGTERCVFGASTLETSLVDGRRRLSVELDCPLPASDARLTGRVEAEGPAVMPGAALRGFADEDNTHAWTPLLTATSGVAELKVGDTSTRLEGRVYHDRNGSPLPLHELGIDHWIWGRCPFDDGERIFYVLWAPGEDAPKAVGLEVGRDGRLTEVESLEVELGPQRRDLYGMPWWRRVVLRSAGEPWLTVDVEHMVDNGPFYLRYITRCTHGDAQALGIGEAVRPDRVDDPMHRPFVRMRVHHLAEENHWLLPLFAGPRAGRVGRLLTSLVGGAR